MNLCNPPGMPPGDDDVAFGGRAADPDHAELQAGLERIGLSSYQAEAYTTLLEHGVLPAVDVAKLSSVPSSRVYDVLADLEREGYIETFEREDKRHARAREPSEVVDQLRHVSDHLSETAESIENQWEEASLLDHQITLLGSDDSAVAQAEKLIREAESTVDVATTPAQYHRLDGALRSAHDNGAVVRASVEGLSSTAVESEQPVTELRSRPIPGTFVAIIDRTHTCFAPNERSPKAYGIVLNDSILSFVFHWYFQTCLWTTSEPVYRSGERPTYVSLEEFVRDVYPFWRAGATVTVTVVGKDIDADEPCEVTGVLERLLFPDLDVADETPPTYVELSGLVSVVVNSDGERYTVGGWGAIFEDIEAEKIRVESAVGLGGPPAL